VVPVFDVGIEEDHVYIVMELVRGATLRAWVAGKTQREILDVYRQAGQALAAAHDAGLVHRDFKPDNAMVDDAGRVRVVDFGLACEAMTGGSTGSRAVGTPRYMAPEQAEGCAATPAADQQLPARRSTRRCAAMRRARCRAGSSSDERGAAGDPAARFASMSELLRALRAIRRGCGGGGWRSGSRPRRSRAARSSSGALTPSDRPELCSGGDRAIASAWSRPRGRASCAGSPGCRATAASWLRQLGRRSTITRRAGGGAPRCVPRAPARRAVGGAARSPDGVSGARSRGAGHARPGHRRGGRQGAARRGDRRARAPGSRRLQRAAAAARRPAAARAGRAGQRDPHGGVAHADADRRRGTPAMRRPRSAARSAGARAWATVRRLAEALVVEGQALMPRRIGGPALAR
jgi:hypothetical protein